LIVLAYCVFAALFGGTPAPAWGLQDVPETKAADGSLNVTAIDEAKAMKGFELAKANCACHGPELRGTAQAPNLHQMFRRQSDAAWFVKFIKNPRSMKPSSTMPALTHLSDSELATISEWLRKPK
jgi:mono/diheme cytochrome c family protein